MYKIKYYKKSAFSRIWSMNRRSLMIFISVFTVIAMLIFRSFYEQEEFNSYTDLKFPKRFNYSRDLDSNITDVISPISDLDKAKSALDPILVALNMSDEEIAQFKSSTSLKPILPVEEVITCKFPQLLVDDPLIAPYLWNVDPLKCREEKNWVYTTNGRFYISPEAVDRHGNITCRLWKYTRKDDYDGNDYDEMDLGTCKNDTLIDAESLYVRCKSINGTQYDNLHATVPLPDPKSKLARRIQNSRAPNGLNMSVFVYLMDSLSRINFMRKLPNFYKVLTERMNGYVMQGFNIVGDGTPWAMIPMLTGHFQTELPEARKRFDNASYLDDWPFVFKDFMDSGYVTSYAEEQPPYSAFSYKLKGFKKPPVDHYLRTFLWLDWNYYKINKEYCLGDTPKSVEWLKYYRQLQNVYRPLNALQFSMLFSSETSHDSYNLVQSLDDHLAKEFETMFNQSLLNDTILIVMGDHGRRFGQVRQTQTGKMEEKLPFLSVVVPPWFRHQYPVVDENLRSNRKRLITVFDLHETFHNILDFQTDPDSGNASQRGISLFKKIPADRTCSNAHIKAHFCSCLDWTDISDLKNSTLLLAAQTVIDYFNGQITQVGDACANLTLGKMISARELTPNDDLMSFKESLDWDNITPNLSADKKLYYIVYQIRFTTEPGGGDWEASLTYFLNTHTFGMSSNDISRLNMYNHQAQCIIAGHPHLRTFCFCNK